MMFATMLAAALTVGNLALDGDFSAMTRFDVAGEDWGVSVPDDDSTLWWMTVCRTDDVTKEIWSVKPTGAKSVKLRDVPGGREIVWRDFVGATADALEEVWVRLSDDGAKTRWRIGATIRPGWAVHACEFPRFILKGDRGKGRDDRIVWGGGVSGVIRDPGNLPVEKPSWMKAAPYDFLFQAHQPSTLAAQFFCRYDSERLFYSACEDGNGHDKVLNCFRYHKDRRILLSWRHVFWATERFALPYDVVTSALRPKNGQPCDWFDAADLYKEWAVKQRWCKAPLLRRTDVPDLYKQAPAYLFFDRRWLIEPEKVKAFLAVVKRDALGNNPALGATFGWEKWAAWCGPDYTPFYPSDEIATAEFKAMRQAGVRPYLWPSTFCYALKWRMPDYETGKRANPKDPFTFDHTADFLREGLDRFAVLKKDGAFDRHVSWMGAGGTQAMLCIGCPETADWFVRTSVDPLMARGATLLQYDQFNNCMATECWATNHGHCLKSGAWRTAAARRNMDHVTAAIRARDPEGILTFEGPNEQLLDKIAIQDTRDCRFFKGDWAYVFNYLYHEYVTPFQAGIHPSRFWFAKIAAEGQMPCFLTAASNYGKDGNSLPEYKSDYDFSCRWTKLYQGEGRPFLAYGRHIRPPQIECARVAYRDVRWSEKISMDQPAVFHSAFEAADGRRAVSLVNVTDEIQKGTLVLADGTRRPFAVGPREIRLEPLPSETKKPDLGGTPDESSVTMGTPPKGTETLADDPRYVARHYSFDIPEGEYWWGGEVLEGLRQPFSRASKDYAVDMRLRHGKAGGDKAAPVLLSSKGRWIWCEQAFAFRVADGKLVIDTEKNAPVTLGTAKEGTLRAAYLECSRRFFPPKGHPQLRFFSEPIINTWIALKYNQNEKEILEIADEFIANGVPPGVYMIDHTWHGDSFGDWNFHQGRFRDPKGMVKKLNAKGYPVMLWFDPHISTDTALYRWMRGEGMLLKKRNHWDTAESFWWPGKAAILDCTNPKTRTWLRDTCNRLMNDFGVEGFFFDAGDAYNYAADAQPFDKLATPSDQVKAFHLIGMDVPYQQHRASWKMGGLPLMQTLRDKHPDFEGIRQCIADGCLSGLLGYPFVTFDMVGGGTVSSFEGDKFKAAQQYFVRSMQVHTLSPMVQFSLSPWKYLDAEHQAIIRKMVALRQKWAPYIVELAVAAGKTGEPMMRLLDYSFPGRGYETVNDEFLMGEKLLVAPQVTENAASRKVVIPPGTWRADDGTVHTGPTTVEVATPLERLPYFERIADGGSATARTDGTDGGAVADAAPDRLVAPELHNVKILGPAGKKIDRFLYGRVRSDFAKETIFGEAFAAIRDRNDDETGVVGFWQGEFWGKLMMSAVRTADYTRDPELIRFVRDECHRLMALEEPDGYLGSYRDKTFVTGPDRRDRAMMERVHKALGKPWDCDYCWNLWGRKYTMWGMLLAYELTQDREILASVERQMNQLIDMMHALKRPLWKTGEPTYEGLPSMSILKPLVCLYRTTGKAKYLDYAKEMLPYWERADGAAPNLVANAFRKDPVHTWYPKPDGWAKAYEMMSCMQGLLEYYRVTGERKYLDAVVALTRNIRDTERNQVGSVGYNDHFNDAIHKPNAVSEPCDVIHWIRLNHELYLITGDTSYADEIELSFYNAMLGSITRDGTWGARCVRSHARNWHDLTGQCRLKYQHCCINNMPRGLMDVAQTFVTADRAGNLKVNLYSDADVTVANAKVSIRGDFPVSNRVTVTVTGLAPGQKVDFRKPAWCPKMDVVEVDPSSAARAARRSAPASQPSRTFLLTFDMNARVVDWKMPSAGTYDFARKTIPNDRRIAQFTNYYVEEDLFPLMRTEAAATVRYGPFILAKSKLVGATEADMTDPFTANLKGYRATVEPIPSTRVWGAWKLTLEKDGDRHVYNTSDLGSACDRVTPYSTDEYSIWF